MGSALILIDLITSIIQKLNYTIPEALVLYRTITGLRKEEYPDLDDASVIALFKTRADAGVAFIDDILAKLHQQTQPTPPVA